MRPSELKTVVSALIDQRQPVMIWGAPGIGKSDIVASIAKDRGIDMIDFRLALRDPTDLKGFPIPDIKSKSMKFLRDAELPTSGRGLLFMDEMNLAQQATMSTAMQLTLPPFRIGDYELPEGWTIIAAGNRDTDRANVNRLPAPLAARFTHVDLDVSLDDWCSWALDNNIATEIISFIRFKVNLLHAFDPAQRSSPNPRGWGFVNKFLDKGHSLSAIFEIAKGTIGEGAAGEFMAFLQVFRELPNVDQILMTPDAIPMPVAPGTLYALSGALSAKLTNSNFERAMKFVDRMPTEYQVVTIRDTLRRDPTVSSTKAFIKWSIDHQNVLM